MKLIQPANSIDNSIRTTLAYSDLFPAKVYFRHYLKPLDLHDPYRYHTGFQNAYRNIQSSLYVDDILASSRSFHGSHHGIFLCISLFFCRA